MKNFILDSWKIKGGCSLDAIHFGSMTKQLTSINKHSRKICSFFFFNSALAVFKRCQQGANQAMHLISILAFCDPRIYIIHDDLDKTSSFNYQLIKTLKLFYTFSCAVLCGAMLSISVTTHHDSLFFAVVN